MHYTKDIKFLNADEELRIATQEVVKHKLNNGGKSPLQSKAEKLSNNINATFTLAGVIAQFIPIVRIAKWAKYGTETIHKIVDIRNKVGSVSTAYGGVTLYTGTEYWNPERLMIIMK